MSAVEKGHSTSLLLFPLPPINFLEQFTSVARMFASLLAAIRAVLKLPKAFPCTHCTAPAAALEDQTPLQSPSEGSTCVRKSSSPPIHTPFSLKPYRFTKQEYLGAFEI